jgi:hypothetical protein
MEEVDYFSSIDVVSPRLVENRSTLAAEHQAELQSWRVSAFRSGRCNPGGPVGKIGLTLFARVYGNECGLTASDELVFRSHPPKMQPILLPARSAQVAHPTPRVQIRRRCNSCRSRPARPEHNTHKQFYGARYSSVPGIETIYCLASQRLVMQGERMARECLGTRNKMWVKTCGDENRGDLPIEVGRKRNKEYP